MAVKQRKDPKGRALRKGETFRSEDQNYRYTYTDVTGKRISIYSKDLLKLREREEEIARYQIDDINAYAAGKASLNFMFDRYMATKKKLKKNTRSNYLYTYDHFVRHTIGKRKLKDLRFSDIMNFYLSVLENTDCAIATLDNIQTLLHPTFKMAVRDGILRLNPTDGIIGQISKDFAKDKGVRHPLTIQQQRAFMNYIKDHEVYDHWNTIFTFLLGTGTRIGECISIRWQDVDFEKRVIDINHNIVYYQEEETKKSKLMVNTVKTEAGNRVIPMMDEVYEVLKQEYELQNIFGFSQAEVDGMTGFIFMNRDGGILLPQNVNDAIKRIVADYNAYEVLDASKHRRVPVILPEFTCHVLRHTFCTRLCEVEDNLKAIQYIMGHASIETTMNIYAEATKERNQEAINNLSNAYKLF